MIKYLQIDNLTKWTITHNDKEIDWLSFMCYFNEDDNKYYIIVDWDEGKITSWRVRNNSTETTEETINSLIETLNNKTKNNL